ncbi:MAG: hypothetical protein WA908_02210 [Pontixanthobacter sp.]
MPDTEKNKHIVHTTPLAFFFPEVGSAKNTTPAPVRAIATIDENSRLVTSVKVAPELEPDDPWYRLNTR